MISFEYLSPTEFEEFVLELLRYLEFTSLTWRKGTGLDTSPADSGRDIEASFIRKDVDGNPYTERWFIECKHQQRGVPPSALDSALTWASAKRPDVLLIVASGFLSNPAKDHLESYQAKNQPPFRIKVWEQKELDQLSLSAIDLRLRFGFETEVPFLGQVHNNHLLYALKPQLNTLEYFFACLDNIDPELRDTFLYTEYDQVIRPRYREAKHPEESIKDLLIDEVSFEAFRSRCESEPLLRDSPTAVHKMMSNALAWALHFSDKSDLPRIINLHNQAIEYFEHIIEKFPENDKMIESLYQSIEFHRQDIERVPSRMEQQYKKYLQICKTLLPELLAEKIPKLSEDMLRDLKRSMPWFKILREKGEV